MLQKKFTIPPKENLGKQLFVSAIVLVAIAVLVAVFAKVAVGAVIFLLGVIMGAGSRIVGGNSFDED